METGEGLREVILERETVCFLPVRSKSSTVVADSASDNGVRLLVRV